jgi:DNA-binding Lrp family transcriptional regulator
MSKTILQEVDGFTPVIDALVDELGLVTAAVFGAVWRYCQMQSSVCTASQDKIAERLRLERRTVMRHIKTLVEHGYLRDLTPELKNRPHTYMDTGKAGLRSRLWAEVKRGVTLNDSTGIESDTTVTLSDPKIQIKKHTDDDDGQPAAQPLAPDQSEALWALRFVGLDDDAAQSLARTHNPDAVRGWCCIAWTRHGPNGVTNMAGFVRSKLDDGAVTPDVAPAQMHEFMKWVTDHRTAKAGLYEK